MSQQSSHEMFQPTSTNIIEIPFEGVADDSLNRIKFPKNDYELTTSGKNEPETYVTQRESLLTILFEDPHIRTIRHIFLICFLGFSFATITQNILEKHEIFSGLRLIRMGFGKFPIVTFGWIFFNFLTYFMYLCFNIWAKIRSEFIPSKPTFKKLLDILAILFISGYYVFSFRLAIYIVETFHLPPASAAIILFEQIRMLMKVYAFVRSNVPKVQNYQKKSSAFQLELPGFGHFVFFTFAPTLIYKDEYPRTPSIRWKIVAAYFLEIFGSIILLALVVDLFVTPKFQNFGERKYMYSELFLKFLQTAWPSTIFFFMGFYVLLHLIQNLFAEMLRFEYRIFYGDWWTSTDLKTYFKSWNVLVHDWLYTYIYKDCCYYVKTKIVAKYFTFLLSALVHEWIIMYTFGFFFPILFCCFLFVGTISAHLGNYKNSLHNIMFLICLSYGSSFIMSGYTLEICARYNNVTPVMEELDFFIPRSLTCDCYL